MNWDEFRTISLSDIGTRYQHYSDLISCWEEGSKLISEYSHIGTHDQSKLDTLNLAIELLRNTLDGIAEYHDLLIELRKLVDFIPTDPTVIPEGRGTPLQKRLGDGNNVE